MPKEVLMFQAVSPFWIPVAVFFGGILAPLLGWAIANRDASIAGQAHEPLEMRRVGASAVISFVASLIFLGQYSAAISVGLPDLELAFVAGFGADKIIKSTIGI
jgi:hypothetical protein